MKWTFIWILACTFAATPVFAQTQSGKVKALVGGTLIDGFGGKPLRNCVIVVEGERIRMRALPGKPPRLDRRVDRAYKYLYLPV